MLLVVTTAGAQHKTLGPGSCGLGQNNCHATQNNTWYRTDAHKGSLDKLGDDLEKAEKYAELSGVGKTNMFKGSSNCMKCHATVVSGKETAEAEEGASCESCHGPGSGYKDPHQEGDRDLGVERPGYVKALQLGMVELKNLDKRAATCVRCHYITEQKLIAAGHSTGKDFNYVNGIRKVAGHWRRPVGDDDRKKDPFEKAKKARGPVTELAVAKPPRQPEPDMNGGQVPSVQTIPEPVATPKPLVPPTPPPADLLAPPVSKGPIELPPFPALSDTTSIEEVLLLLKIRLELLYQKTR